MKKFTSIFIAIVIAATTFLTPILIAATPVFAEGEKCNCANGEEGTRIPTTIIYACDCGGGEGIMQILKLVIDILTAGISVVAVIGITIAGIQYLTAGGNEEQVRKAKRRVFEIVLGIAIYLLIYVILYWLIPDFRGLSGITN